MTSEQKWDLVIYRLENAKKTFAEVDVLMQNNLYNTAINRLYYACFYAVSALLLHNNISTRTHTGAIQMFGLDFVKTGLIEKAKGDFYSKLYDMRHDGDYEDYVDYGEKDVSALLQPAKDLISQIEVILYNN